MEAQLSALVQAHVKELLAQREQILFAKELRTLATVGTDLMCDPERKGQK